VCAAFHAAVKGLGAPLRRPREAFWQLTLFIDAVDDAEGLRLLGGHEVIAIQGALDAIIRLPRMLYVDFVEPALGGDDVLGVAFDVRSLAAEATGWLVHHDARIGKRDA